MLKIRQMAMIVLGISLIWLAGGANEAATAQPAEGKELILDLGNGVSMKLVQIPAGEFVMGAPANEEHHYGDEEPQRRVKISRRFYMGVTEVTQQQYTAVMGVNPSRFIGPANPVDQVTWDKASAFCERLSLKTDKTVALPTEAQWEYTCRAGTTTRFAFGDSDEGLDAWGWYRKNSDRQTHPVGQKKPNAWGLYDMYGNVSEWCSDWYQDSYQRLSVTDPTGPAEGSLRIRRGGSWSADAADCRSAARLRIHPSNGHSTSGFRVVVLPRQ